MPNTSSTNSNLTYEKMRAMLDSLPKREPSLFDNVFTRPKFAGLNVYDAPPPTQKIKVRDIKFSDGTSILSAKFLAQINAKFAATFGYQEDIYKDKAYVLGNYGIVMKPEYRHMIVNLTGN